jgi:glycosidase
MIYEAIYHSADSEYCHAIDRNTLIIRLKAKRGDLEKCVVYYGDRVYPREVVRFDSTQMRIVASDRLFDYFEALIHTELTRFCYYFILSDGKQSTYYYGYDFHDRLEYNRNLYFQLPYIREEDIADVPEWAKRAIIYQIFPDSFATSKEFISGMARKVPLKTSCSEQTGLLDGATKSLSEGWNENKAAIYSKSKLGGTLRGVTENIPYLEELGINCIYLTPIFTAGEYHKYDTIDYFSVDPCFGNLQDFKDLVAQCHEAGIRVILDGVFNHCGAGFFAFKDVCEKGEASKYKDWFFAKGFPVNVDKPNYETFAYVSSMPKLNTGNKEVAEYFINVGTYWIKEADIDGWRLDVANEINHDFWRDFRRAIREVKPEAFMIGEVWYDAVEWLRGDQFDSLMNYSFLYACDDFFAKRKINVKQFCDKISYLSIRYKKNVQYVQMNLLDSHDVSRFISQAGGDVRRLKLGALFMMMYIGAPNIFYGDEKGLDGLAESDYRRPMQWTDTEYSNNIFCFYKKLIGIRKEHMELMLGDYVTRDVDIANDTLMFSREAEGKRLYVIINNSEFPVRYVLDVSSDSAGSGRSSDSCLTAKELISEKMYEVENSRIDLALNELSGMIIKVTEVKPGE